jgi:hypothetical protein
MTRKSTQPPLPFRRPHVFSHTGDVRDEEFGDARAHSPLRSCCTVPTARQRTVVQARALVTFPMGKFCEKWAGGSRIDVTSTGHGAGGLFEIVRIVRPGPEL